MRLSDYEKGRPLARAANSETDQLTGDHLNGTPTADLATAEQAVVGACILASASIRREVQKVLENADLTDGTCRLLDRTMRTMESAGLPVDPVTLAGYIEEHRLTGGLELRHIRSTIHHITSVTPVALNAAGYAQLVVQASCRRTLISAADEIRRIAQLDSLDDLLQAVGIQGKRAMAAIARATAVAE